MASRLDDITTGVATATPARGRSISSSPGITPFILGQTLSEEKKVQYKSSVQDISTSSLDVLRGANSDTLDQALTNVLSLPQVLSQVTSKFKDHTQELERLKQQTDHKQTILTAEATRLQVMVDDVRSTERKIYLGEDQEDQIKQICQQHQNDLDKLLILINGVQEEVMVRESEMEIVMSRLQKYGSKMVKHVQKVRVMDEDVDTFRQLRHQHESTEKLEKQKRKLEDDAESTKLRNGTAEAELRAAIGVMKEALKQIEINFRGQQEKMNNCKTKQKQIQTDISVLHKRNAAQMTRLKRQVKEVNTSNKHWQDQASYLQAAIQQLKSDE